MTKKPKKSLGQNFLKAQSVVDKIVETANLNTKDTVLEVGPGKGILTESLLKKAGKVISVEKDAELIPFLKEKFKKEIKSGKLILVNGDILTFNFQLYKLSNFKIVANIPYYITGEFLRKTLSSDIQPSQMVLLVQKEVAERIAKSKKESILSISVKAYGEPKYIQTVKAGNFTPSPKVDSAILAINNISKKFFTSNKKGLSFFQKKDSPFLSVEDKFFEVVKTGFAHKRKFLISNLEKCGHPTPTPDFKEILKKAFKQAKIEERARAEEVKLDQWGQLVARFL